MKKLSEQNQCNILEDYNSRIFYGSLPRTFGALIISQASVCLHTNLRFFFFFLSFWPPHLQEKGVGVGKVYQGLRYQFN